MDLNYNKVTAATDRILKLQKPIIRTSCPSKNMATTTFPVKSDIFALPQFADDAQSIRTASGNQYVMIIESRKLFLFAYNNNELS